MVKQRIDAETARRRAQLGGRARWAKEKDRTAATAPMRDAMRRRWEDQVDPERKFSEEVRDQLVEVLRREHMAKMTRARAAKRAEREAAAARDTPASSDPETPGADVA